MLFLPDALAPLAAYRQFVAYVLVPSQTRPGKTDKFPVDCVTGKVDNAHNPAIWTDAATACATAARLGASYGVGFVFTENDPFFFLDIDGCLEPSGVWSQLSQSLVAAFPGAAVEVSSSGKGLHIIGTGRCGPHKKKNEQYGLEFYTEKRFVALTGLHASGSVSTDCSHLLPSLVHQFFLPTAADVGAGFDWTTGPCEGWRGPTDDDKLLERALRSSSAKAAFGTSATFRDLFEGNVEVLAKVYPDDARPFDESRADAALAQHLAFWTGNDCARILRLMMRSALVRDKWNRDDYLRERTIPKAVVNQTEVLQDRLPEPVAGMHVAELMANVAPGVPAPWQGLAVPAAPGKAAEATAVTGSTFLTIEQQIDLFKGCVYVFDIGRVLVPGGLLLRPEQFRVMFGGYSFPMDNANERTSRDAFEAFTQSQAYRSPRADGTCFKPDRAPGELIRDAGRTRVNVWWPVNVPRTVGDATPFLVHLAKVLPVERDRVILLSYMAACVQYKGVKFQWAPLLQGAEGNGKTLFTRCVAEAIGRRYVHWPKASQLGSQFNAWLLNKLFYGVEDINVTHDKAELLEELKPMITGEELQIEAKGVDQTSADVCGNFMFNSNHKDALRKHRNDRRYCILFSAQQTADDIIAAGMGGDYFSNLYDWLKSGGYAIVSELLHTYQIPDEFNPATTCQRAPITSSTEAAIEASLGGIEQEILEVIEQSAPGFAGGWVSSIKLDELLKERGRARSVPLNKRRDLLLGLGYDWHPGLIEGRVNNTVLPDNGKPRLFVKKGHPAAAIVGAAEISRAYSAAQMAGLFPPP